MLVTEEKLKEVTGYSNVSTMVSSLKRQGVSFLRGKNGKVFTTIDALNIAMNVYPEKQSFPPDQFIEI